MDDEKKGLVDKVRELVFSKDELKPESKVEFSEVKLENGETINVDGAIAVDSKTEAANGDYILEDGKTLKVSEGVITEIVEAKEEEEKEVEKEDKSVVEPELAEDEDVNPLEARVAELEKMIESLMSQFSEVNVKVQEFSALPSDKEIEIKKVELSSNSVSNTGIEGLANWRKKSLKK